MTAELPSEQQQTELLSSPKSSLWDKICAYITDEFGAHITEAYLSGCGLIPGSDKDGSVQGLTIEAPSKLVCSYVEEKLLPLITQVVRKETENSSLSVTVSVCSDPAKREAARQNEVRFVKRAPSTNNIQSKPTAASGLNPRYTFETYVVGNGNQFSHAAAARVAESPGSAYNPLFIYGGVGLGKTHLLHAIGNAALERNPNANVMYLSSEAFTNELISALRLGKMDQFKTKMRSVDLLLIDDIQFMAGKERTQEEFFHTFNTLYGLKHQIVITSDKLPSAIPGIEERLQTRFFWGLTADLQAPDFETRVAILKRKAHQEGFDVPSEVAVFIAKRISSNVRELEGALTRVFAVASLKSETISLSLAEQALQALIPKKPDHLTIDQIKKVVAQQFGIKFIELASKRRTKNLSFPRHIAMYLCRKHTTFSYPEIATHFGGRDHSSVVHAASVVSSKLVHDQELKERIESIEKLLGL